MDNKHSYAKKKRVRFTKEDRSIEFSIKVFDNKFKLVQAELAKGHTIKEMLNMAKPYYIGSFNVTSWLWTKKQRLDKESPSLQYQRDLLEELGMSFKKSNSFDQGLSILKALKNERPDVNLNNIVKSKKPYMIGDFDAQRWLETFVLQYKRSYMPEEKAEKVKALGLDLSEVDSIRQALFEKTMKKIKKAIADGHNIDDLVAGENGEDVVYNSLNVTNFLSEKYRLFKKGLLPEYQRKEIEELGYDLSSSFASIAEGARIIRQEIKDQAKKGKIITISDIAIAKKIDDVYVGYKIDDFEATVWCDRIRKLMKEGKLTKKEEKVVGELFYDLHDVAEKPSVVKARQQAQKDALQKADKQKQPRNIKIEPVQKPAESVFEPIIEKEKPEDEHAFDELEKMLERFPKLNINVVANGMFDGETGKMEPYYSSDGTNLTELLQRQLVLQKRGALSPNREKELSVMGLEWLPKKKSRETTIDDI